MATDRFSKNINIRNKQATFGYELLDTYVAGIVMKGTEIKSVREGKVNLTAAPPADRFTAQIRPP